MADISRSKNSTQKGDKGQLSAAQTDRQALKDALKYQQQLLGQYLPTQQQTAGQSQQLLGQGVEAIGPVVRGQEEQDRLAQLRFMRQYGVAVNRAGRRADPELEALYARLGGDLTGGSPLDAQLNAQALGAGPSRLSQLLGTQAEEQLALGGSLSPEEQRQAQQAARGAWADRGLQFSNPAILQEVLNRTSLSDARLAGRQNFAGNVNQQLLGEQQSNRGFQLGVGQHQMGRDAQGLDFARLRESTSPLNQLLSRPTNSGLLLGGAESGLQQGTGGAMNLTGLQDQYAGFLMNRDASQRIAELNARTGLQTGQMSADAAKSAGDSQLLGAGIGAVGTIAAAALLLCHVAREVYGEADPRWQIFRQWLLGFAGPRRLRRYRIYGPTIAGWIATRPAYKARMRRWMDRCIGELAGTRLAA